MLTAFEHRVFLKRNCNIDNVNEQTFTLLNFRHLAVPASVLFKIALMAEQDSSMRLSLSSIWSILVSTLSRQSVIVVKIVVIPKTWNSTSPWTSYEPFFNGAELSASNTLLNPKDDSLSPTTTSSKTFSYSSSQDSSSRSARPSTQ